MNTARLTAAAEVGLDTPSGDIMDAVERGDFTAEDLRAELPRLKHLAAERAQAAQQALDRVREQDSNKRRKSPWGVQYLRDSGLFLVSCGPAYWHVDNTGSIRRIR